jgi:hypothetical protein
LIDVTTIVEGILANKEISTFRKPFRLCDHEARKDSYSEEFQAWDYAIRGKTLDGRNLRVVVAIVAPNILVVTTIDLDKED